MAILSHEKQSYLWKNVTAFEQLKRSIEYSFHLEQREKKPSDGFTFEKGWILLLREQAHCVEY